MQESINDNINISQNSRQKNLSTTIEVKDIIKKFQNKYPDLPKKLKDLKLHHEESYNHLEDIAFLAYDTANYLKLSNEKKDLITLSAYLHDIGKINTDINILNKTSDLTEFEYEQIKKHVEDGYNIVSQYDRDIANIIYYHHKFKKIFPYPKDAAIYPDDKIKRNISETENYKNEIKKLGKILAIIDAYHALISKRPYNKDVSIEDCKQIIIDNLNLNQEDENLVDFLINENNQGKNN